MDETLLTLFQSRLRDAGGWCESLRSSEEIISFIREKYSFAQEDIFISGRLAGTVRDIAGIGLDIGSVTPAERKGRLAGAKLAITACDGLIAGTGTAVLVNHPAEPRALSLLPERHLVIATAAQLFSTLAECLAELTAARSGTALPSITLISGPSRTSDIEKTLVVGVHGPIEFGVIIGG
jgi:hypothetical protein